MNYFQFISIRSCTKLPKVPTLCVTWKLEWTRMHSSRMRTVCPLTIVPVCMLGWGGWPLTLGGGGWPLTLGGRWLTFDPSGWCSGGWWCPGVCQGGGVGVQGDRHPLHLWPGPPPGSDHLPCDHVTYPLMQLVSPPPTWTDRWNMKVMASTMATRQTG